MNEVAPSYLSLESNFHAMPLKIGYDLLPSPNTEYLRSANEVFGRSFLNKKVHADLMF